MCKTKQKQFDRSKTSKARQKQKKVNLVQDEYTDEDSTNEESDWDDTMFMGVTHDVNSVTPESGWRVKYKVSYAC